MNIPEFIPYGKSHLLVILLSICIPVLVFHTRKFHQKHADILSKIIGIAGLSFFPIHFLVYYFVLKTFDIKWDLPILQVCGITTLAVCLELLTKKRFFLIISYFWGIGAMLASFLAPALKEDFPHIYFWLFWGSHLDIIYILSFIFTIKKPNIKYYEVWISSASLAVYAAIMYVFNLKFNSNYAFVMQKPEIIHFGYLGGINFDESPNYILPATITIITLFHLLYFVPLLVIKVWNYLSKRFSIKSL